VGEPTRRKLIGAVRHVLAAKHSQLKHLTRRKLRPKFWIELPANRCYQCVAVAALHTIIDRYYLHGLTLGRHGTGWCLHACRVSAARSLERYIVRSFVDTTGYPSEDRKTSKLSLPPSDASRQELIQRPCFAHRQLSGNCLRSTASPERGRSSPVFRYSFIEPARAARPGSATSEWYQRRDGSETTLPVWVVARASMLALSRAAASCWILNGFLSSTTRGGSGSTRVRASAYPVMITIGTFE